MELVFRSIAGNAALALEAMVVLLVCAGAIETLLALARYMLAGGDSRAVRRSVWLRFARWLVLALEFALGADIIRTAIAPSWSDIGQLAVIAAVRTALGFFLERDIESVDETGGDVPADAPD